MKTHFSISTLKKHVCRGFCVLTSETTCSSYFMGISPKSRSCTFDRILEAGGPKVVSKISVSCDAVRKSQKHFARKPFPRPQPVIRRDGLRPKFFALMTLEPTPSSIIFKNLGIHILFFNTSNFNRFFHCISSKRFP